MSSTIQLKKKVKTIEKTVIGYRKPHYAKGIFPYGDNGEWVRFKIVGKKVTMEPVSKEVVFMGLTDWYHRVIRKHKHLAEQYPTFEDWWKDRERFGLSEFPEVK